jgi:hypothetical protein
MKFTLLGSVTQPAGLVRTCGPGGAVDLGELTELPAPDTEQVTHSIALFFASQLLHILVGAHDSSYFESETQLKSKIKTWACGKSIKK